jgi:hypothetical protein
LKILPVKRYMPPSYPTRAMLRTHPDLFRRSPKRWHNSALIAALLATTASATWADSGQIASQATRAVLPTGVPPPPVVYFVALSEADACQVINEQLEEAGLHTTTEQLITRNLALETASPNQLPAQSGSITETISITFDGANIEHGISYEFLSWDDRAAIGGNGIDRIEAFRSALEKSNPRGTDAVFYDTPVLLSVLPNLDVKCFPGLVVSNRFTDKTLMPLNVFRFPLGCGIEASDTSTITLMNGVKKVIVNIGNDIATINDTVITLPRPVTTIDGIVYVPVRAVAEGLGFTVIQMEETGIIAIESNPHCANHQLDGTNSQAVYRGSFSPVLVPAVDSGTSDGYAFINYDIGARNAMVLRESKRLLRLQVEDFIAWLKAEGVL